MITEVVLGSVIVIATLRGYALAAEPTAATLTPKVLEEIAQVEAEIDRIEGQTRERLATPPDNQVQQIELLGKVMRAVSEAIWAAASAASMWVAV